MSERLHLDPALHLADPGGKEKFNRTLFTVVAPKYDFVTRALSFGRDAAWKRKLVQALPDRNAPRCLDLACGTGDLTQAVAERYPGSAVTGLDLTPAMLALARSRAEDVSIRYVEGSMDEAPFENASFDIVTGGYALRNAPNLDRTIEEIRRVLVPGGLAAFLDFSKPPSALGRAMSYGLLKGWGAFWGLVLHRDADVYGYIAESLRLYPDRIELRARFLAHGFRVIHARRHFLGMLETLVLVRT